MVLGYGRRERGRKKASTVARSAEQPGQAVNVDLCFVPEEHLAAEALPAVSGSSGRLVVGRGKGAGEEAHWPGQVFADAERDYESAMAQYAQAAQARLLHRQGEREPILVPAKPWREEREGQVARYRLRQQRKQEDIAWQAAKVARRQERQSDGALSSAEREQHREAWRQRRAERRTVLLTRQQEDQLWHKHNRQRQAEVTATEGNQRWIAILAVVDNCTRQCLGLPLFLTAARVTSREIGESLRLLLPATLHYLISDQGMQFRSQTIAQLAEERRFVHVPIYRHRPESNGIAERFVLTLKNWLCTRSWQGGDSLSPLLAEFLPEYNERPHQGLAIPGLSPNEFAKRVWLM